MTKSGQPAPLTRPLAVFGVVLAVLGCRTGEDDATGRLVAPDTEFAIRFEDITKTAGLRFTHHTGADGRFLMPESVGPGGGFLDYDGDGWLDVFLVNSCNWPGQGSASGAAALYRNRRDGTFLDVTREAGLSIPIYGQGCAIADYDADGDDDLLVTCVGPNRLFRNLGNGKFEQVTDAGDLSDGPRWAWHTSAAWLDYDRDGLLDVFVCRYVKWSPTTDVPCKAPSGARTYCGPAQYARDASILYRNLGEGRFHDVSDATGITGALGKGLGVVALDENQDGWPDLVVTNDLTANHLWRNEGGRRFHEVAQEMGVAVGESGQPRAGMGIDFADVKNDGGLAFAIGNFAGEGLALYSRDPAGYADTGRSAGLVPPSLNRLTFGLLFLDADRDGWSDLFTYNGHVDPLAGENGESVPFRQMPQFFRNQQGKFTDVTSTAGPPLQKPQVGRGCATGDFDNDGRPDLLLCENSGPARLLRNVTGGDRRWLGVQLRGRGANRNGYGAEVRLTAGGVTQRRWVRSGGSFLSHSDSRALFGIGEAATDVTLEVLWPSGAKSTLATPALDRYLVVDEPER